MSLDFQKKPMGKFWLDVSGPRRRPEIERAGQSDYSGCGDTWLTV